MTAKSIGYFLKSLLYYPFRYYSDPTYSLPKGLFRELSRRAKKLNWDLDNIIPIFKSRKKQVIKQAKIHILGHVHEKYVEDRESRVIIHPGSWRDEYDLNHQTKQLIPRPKRYVQVLVADHGLDYQLIEFPIKRSIFNFNQVVKNEAHFIRLAAQEEGYQAVFY